MLIVADNEHLTFRGNSIATKAMEAYMKLVGERVSGCCLNSHLIISCLLSQQTLLNGWWLPNLERSSSRIVGISAQDVLYDVWICCSLGTQNAHEVG